MSTLQSIIEWHRVADELPDDETTVILAFHDAHIEPGYHDETGWRQLDNMKLPSHYQPILWADVPDVSELVGNAPALAQSGGGESTTKE